MRKPGNQPTKSVDDFINGAEESQHSDQAPWQRSLSKKYDKDSGKTVNVRLPEYYAACLQYLSEQDNRSQHGELLHLITSAIDQAVKKAKSK